MPDSRRTSVVDVTLATAAARAIPCAAGGGSPVPVVDPNHTWDSSTKTHAVKGLALVTTSITSVSITGGIPTVTQGTTAGMVVGRYATVGGSPYGWLNGLMYIQQILSATQWVPAVASQTDQSDTPSSGTVVFNPQTANQSEHRDGAGTVFAAFRPDGTLLLTVPAYSNRPPLELRPSANNTLATGGFRVQSPNDVPGDNGTWSHYDDNYGNVYNVATGTFSGHKAGTGEGFRIHSPFQPMPVVLGVNLSAWADDDGAFGVRSNDAGAGTGHSCQILGLDDVTNTYAWGVVDPRKFVWGRTASVDANRMPLWDTYLDSPSAGVLETGGHFVVRGTDARFDIINDTTTFAWFAVAGAADLEIQIGGVSVWAANGSAGRLGQINLVAPAAQSFGCGLQLFSGAGKAGSITQNINGHILILPDAAGLLLLGPTFTTYADNSGNFRVGGNFAVGGGTALLKKVSAVATLDFPSVAAGGQQELTITVTGAVVGGSVQLGPPAAPEAGLVWGGRVSAADTVTVRLTNVTGSPIDPASASWRAVVENY